MLRRREKFALLVMWFLAEKHCWGGGGGGVVRFVVAAESHLQISIHVLNNDMASETFSQKSQKRWVVLPFSWHGYKLPFCMLFKHFLIWSMLVLGNTIAIRGDGVALSAKLNWVGWSILVWKYPLFLILELVNHFDIRWRNNHLMLNGNKTNESSVVFRRPTIFFHLVRRRGDF